MFTVSYDDGHVSHGPFDWCTISAAIFAPITSVLQFMVWNRSGSAAYINKCHMKIKSTYN